MSINIKILSDNYVPPVRSSEQAAGMDLHSPINLILQPNKPHLIPMGFALEIPHEYFIQIVDRSSMALRGVHVMGGTLDSDYRGQVLLLLHNHSTIPIHIKVGDRIAQGLVLKSYRFPIIHVGELSKTKRGEDGMGSTGM
jgi:dUTP pyrophosphatase